MFVYIGLADMVNKYFHILVLYFAFLKIPELISMADEVEKDYIESKKSITTILKLKIFLCQNSGVILGVMIMFLLARYGTHLENLVYF
jgi:hypothetical protein